MGSCATREKTRNSFNNSVIPEPIMYRESNFVVLHYCSLNATYDSFQEFLRSIPNCITSEIAEYKTLNKNLIVISGIEHSNSELSQGIVIETLKNNFLVQVGSVETICLLLKSEELKLVSSFVVDERNYARNFQSIIDKLYKNSSVKNNTKAISLVNDAVSEK